MPPIEYVIQFAAGLIGGIYLNTLMRSDEPYFVSGVGVNAGSYIYVKRRSFLWPWGLTVASFWLGRSSRNAIEEAHQLCGELNATTR